MSKDKGSKNHKKAPSGKSAKDKPISSYKAESKSKEPALTVFAPKPELKHPEKDKRQ